MLTNLPNSVKFAMAQLNESGFEACLVGGCVRDWLMGLEPHDFDLTTNAKPSEIIAVFSAYRVIETGLKHGTVTVLIDGVPIEITTYRIDGKYSDNRRPENVEFTGNLREDLARRDFTMNAIAFSSDGIIDLYKGRQHITDKKIVCVGKPEVRFNEDSLRILRAMRFSATLGFDIEQKTKAAIHKFAFLLNNISSERKLSELKKLICGVRAGEVLAQFGDVARILIPKLNADDSCFIASCKRIDSLPANAAIRLAALLEPLGAQNAAVALAALRADNKLISSVKQIVSHADLNVDSYEQALRLISSVGYETAEQLADYLQSPVLHEFITRAKSKNACVSIGGLEIGGDELIAMGATPGAEIGATLSALLDMVISSKLDNDRKQLINAAKQILNLK